MAAEEAVLGLDTSCYTTSAALMDLHGHLLGDQRRLLRVKPGHRGLAQSEMVFQHTRNLPDLLEALDLSGVQVKAIGVSAKPRPREESYMPAFLVGLGMARSLGKLMGLPVHRFTHQHNHMFAGLWSVGKPAPDRFLLVHISGGTTDLLLCERQPDGNFSLEPRGTSIDLHAGQFIDRVGVALGLPYYLAFPAAVAGNIIPAPFIIVYIRRIFQWMRRRIPRLNGMVDRLERKAHLQGETVTRYQYLGLWLVVAIPLPGTGAWTGALAAAFLEMRLRKALPAVILGVLTAGCIMLLLTHVGINLFSGMI